MPAPDIVSPILKEPEVVCTFNRPVSELKLIILPDVPPELVIVAFCEKAPEAFVIIKLDIKFNSGDGEF